MMQLFYFEKFVVGGICCLGLDITHVVVGSVDMLRDMAIVKVYYRDQKGSDDVANGKLKLTRDDYAQTD